MTDYSEIVRSWVLCPLGERHSELRPKAWRGSMFRLGNQISPLDLFCYLHARFGEPNGEMMLLKEKDDVNNLFHWEYSLKNKMPLNKTARSLLFF